MIICQFRFRCEITLVLIVISLFIFITPIARAIPKGSWKWCIYCSECRVILASKTRYDVIIRLVPRGNNLARVQVPMAQPY